MPEVYLRRGGKRSKEDRLKAIHNLQSLLGRLSVDEAFERGARAAQVTEATMRQWYADYQQGEVFDPAATAPVVAAPATGKKQRRTYDEAFKAKAVEAYRSQPHLHADQIAQELGIAPALLTGWAAKAGAGRKAKAGTALARPEPTQLSVPQQLALPAIEPREERLLAQVQAYGSKLADARELLHFLVDKAFAAPPAP